MRKGTEWGEKIRSFNVDVHFLVLHVNPNYFTEAGHSELMSNREH